MRNEILITIFANRINTAKGEFPNIDPAESIDIIETLCSDHMPSGSGFDSGTTLDLDKSSRGKLHFETAFHHMNENGYYNGWTHHSVIITPSFHGFDIRVTGRDKQGIKDYIADCFKTALGTAIRHVYENKEHRFFNIDMENARAEYEARQAAEITLAERLDPDSPHHEPELLAKRKAAFPHLYEDSSVQPQGVLAQMRDMGIK